MSLRNLVAHADEYLRNSGIVLLVGFIFLFLAVAAFEAGPRSEEFWKIFFTELGFAFIIGGIIAFSIERVARIAQHREIAQQLEMIKTNVFVAVYGPKANDAFFHHFKKQILDRSFLRRQCTVHAQLSYLAAEIETEKVMLLKIVSHSIIVNEGSHNSRFNYSSFVEQPWESKYEKYASATMSVDGKVVTQTETRGDFLRTHVDLDFAPHQAMNVASTFQTVKYDRDNSSFITRIPADKMSITIAYPDDVELYAQSRNAGELNILNRGSTSGIVVATIEEPIFPGGGFEFWWRRTRTEEERKVGARTTPPPGGPAGAAST